MRQKEQKEGATYHCWGHWGGLGVKHAAPVAANPSDVSSAAAAEACPGADAAHWTPWTAGQAQWVEPLEAGSGQEDVVVVACWMNGWANLDAVGPKSTVMLSRFIRNQGKKSQVSWSNVDSLGHSWGHPGSLSSRAGAWAPWFPVACPSWRNSGQQKHFRHPVCQTSLQQRLPLKACIVRSETVEGGKWARVGGGAHLHYWELLRWPSAVQLHAARQSRLHGDHAGPSTEKDHAVMEPFCLDNNPRCWWYTCSCWWSICFRSSCCWRRADSSSFLFSRKDCKSTQAP